MELFGLRGVERGDEVTSWGGCRTASLVLPLLCCAACEERLSSQKVVSEAGCVVTRAHWVPPVESGQPNRCLPDPGLGYELAFAVDVDDRGDVTGIRFPEGTEGRLAQCLTEEARGWMFVPAQACGGKPVPSVVEMTAGPYEWLDDFGP